MLFLLFRVDCSEDSAESIGMCANLRMADWVAAVKLLIAISMPIRRIRILIRIR